MPEVRGGGSPRMSGSTRSRTCDQEGRASRAFRTAENFAGTAESVREAPGGTPKLEGIVKRLKPWSRATERELTTTEIGENDYAPAEKAG